jgi:hypothetical protein
MKAVELFYNVLESLPVSFANKKSRLIVSGFCFSIQFTDHGSQFTDVFTCKRIKLER